MCSVSDGCVKTRGLSLVDPVIPLLLRPALSDRPVDLQSGSAPAAALRAPSSLASPQFVFGCVLTRGHLLPHKCLQVRRKWVRHASVSFGLESISVPSRAVRAGSSPFEKRKDTHRNASRLAVGG